MAGPALYNGEKYGSTKKNNRSKGSKGSMKYKGKTEQSSDGMSYNGGPPGKYNMDGLEGVEAADRSKTTVSRESSRNSGPGQGQYAAGIGDPINLGLSTQMFLPGGTAGKIRGETDEATQRPQSMPMTIDADRGDFQDIY